MKPWWAFSLFDCVYAVAWLLFCFAILGPPSYKITWFAIPVSLMFGKWLSHKWNTRGEK